MVDSGWEGAGLVGSVAQSYKGFCFPAEIISHSVWLHHANGLRRRRARPGDKWHLDEVFIKINETLHYLWRALDQHGEVLDILVQSRCRRQGDQAVLPPVT